MNRAHGFAGLATVALGFAIASPALAQSQQAYVDVEAGGGYATNPGLQAGDNLGAAFARASVRGASTWTSGRDVVTVTGYAEDSAYSRGFGNQFLFSANGDATRDLDARHKFYARIGLTGNEGGQLGSRLRSFLPAPTLPGADPAQPITLADPNLITTNGRQINLTAMLGMAIQASVRDTVDLSINSDRLWLSNSALDGAYQSVGGRAAFNRQVNENWNLGLASGLTFTHYHNGLDTVIADPRVTARYRLSQFWEFAAGVGGNYVRQKRPLIEVSSFNLGYDGSFCNTPTTRERACLRGSQSTQNTALGSVASQLSIGADYYHQFDLRQTLAVSASFERFKGLGAPLLGIGGVNLDHSKSYNASATYTRDLSDRMIVGAGLTFRKLDQPTIARDADVAGSLFVRLRVGRVYNQEKST